MLTAHSKTCRFAAPASSSRHLISAVTHSGARLSDAFPSSLQTIHTSAYTHSACCNRSRNKWGTVCNAAPKTPPTQPAADRRKSERSAARRRPRTLSPPPLPEGATPEETPSTEYTSPLSRTAEAPLEPDWADTAAEAPTRGETTASPRGRTQLGGQSGAPVTDSDMGMITSQRRRPAEPIPEDDIPADVVPELQPSGGGGEESVSIPQAWEAREDVTTAAVEVEVEVVDLQDRDQGVQDAALVLEEGVEVMDLPTDPAESEQSVAERQRAAEEAYMREQLKERMNRKAAILLEILNAGDAVEAKIRQHREDIDEDMLQMLLKRIEATQRYDEPDDVAKSMALMWMRLRSEASRNAATPAERLLDDALEILGSRSQIEYQARKQEAAERLTAAFTAAGSRSVNIFGMAEILATGGTVAAEEAVCEYVPRSGFVEEAQQLLNAALARSGELRDLLDSGELGEEDADAVTEELTSREEAVNHLQDVLMIARALPSA